VPLAKRVLTPYGHFCTFSGPWFLPPRTKPAPAARANTLGLLTLNEGIMSFPYAVRQMAAREQEIETRMRPKAAASV
jgi:hypothetical protein